MASADQSEGNLVRICICGLGKVGRPLYDTFKAKGFQVIGYDCNSLISECTIERAVRESDAVVIIVPTPSLSDGSFDHTDVGSALGHFHQYAKGRLDYLYIVGSTVMPGTCDRLQKRIGDMVCYKPEFIRLAHVYEDMASPAFTLIGEGSRIAGDRCETIYRKFAPNAPVKRMSLVEAELTKLTVNCALTMRISMANQLYLVAKRLGADPAKIMDAVGSDPRIGHSYLTPGAPFGGPCLPRDNRAFIHAASVAGVSAPLSAATDIINELDEIQKLPDLQKW